MHNGVGCCNNKGLGLPENNYSKQGNNICLVQGASLAKTKCTTQGKAVHNRSTPPSATPAPAAVAIDQQNACLVNMSSRFDNAASLGQQAKSSGGLCRCRSVPSSEQTPHRRHEENPTLLRTQLATRHICCCENPSACEHLVRHWSRLALV